MLHLAFLEKSNFGINYLTIGDNKLIYFFSYDALFARPSCLKHVTVVVANVSKSRLPLVVWTNNYLDFFYMFIASKSLFHVFVLGTAALTEDILILKKFEAANTDQKFEAKR